ncbi:hypothetical protein G4L39_04360 [Limisphaera ngatamarikiensis]|uniref:Outer membrane beta-barrel protein n=1 Tax=Limisphaera ngatamarikiensis TaxID=1324935 RepID=A0A6M1RT66_9BACT|nr:hypothetical protein [Limisphaera ngatamarikiensis]NGO38634.1 hypothetical protein [Limisphaera ngatamarikiensis]
MKSARPQSQPRIRTRRPVPWWTSLFLAPAVSLFSPGAAARETGTDTTPPGTEASKASTTDSAETDAPGTEMLSPQQWFEGGAENYNNWIEFAFGGLLTRGNRAEAQARHQLRDGVFGGIRDLHYQAEVAKGLQLSLDGRALFDERDYRLTLDLTKEAAWFLRFHASQSRLWSPAAGGGYGPDNHWYTFPGEDVWGLDRTELGVEAGLTRENLPQVTFRYRHRTREGTRDSTTWGMAHPSTTNPNRALGTSPAFYDLDEVVDTFELDVKHRIKQTDVGLGLRYETADLDNARKVLEYPGEPVERKLTDRQGTQYDLFSVHAWTETWLRKNLFLSTGYLHANLDSDFDGSRIYGTDFDVGYVPGYPLGYTSLTGGAQQREHVFNANLMYQPHAHWTLIPSLRVQKLDADANTSGQGTLGSAGSLFSARSERDLIDVRERLEIRYTGLTNWSFQAVADWTQSDGSLDELGGLSLVGGTGVAPVQRKTDDSRFFQKYSLGARWYATRWATLQAGAYFKRNRYEYDHTTDSTANNSFNRYPAYLEYQRFDTWDAHAVFTLRPWTRLNLITRYEFQQSTVDTRPDTASGLGQTESADITSHIVQQSVGFTPWSRLTLQGSWSYVWSEIETPASQVTRALLASQNNYWMAQLNALFVVDDRTDLNTGWFYYRSDNFEDTWADGLPLGAGVEEQGVTATCTRRLSPHLRLTLRYGYVHHRDETFGQSRNYEAHWVASTLQYRF